MFMSEDNREMDGTLMLVLIILAGLSFPLPLIFPQISENLNCNYVLAFMFWCCVMPLMEVILRACCRAMYKWSEERSGGLESAEAVIRDSPIIVDIIEGDVDEETKDEHGLPREPVVAKDVTIVRRRRADSDETLAVAERIDALDYV